MELVSEFEVSNGADTLMVLGEALVEADTSSGLEGNRGVEPARGLLSCPATKVMARPTHTQKVIRILNNYKLPERIFDDFFSGLGI